MVFDLYYTCFLIMWIHIIYYYVWTKCNYCNPYFFVNVQHIPRIAFIYQCDIFSIMIIIQNKTAARSSSPILLKAKVSSVNITRCRTFYQPPSRKTPQGLKNQQLCAISETADTCQVSLYITILHNIISWFVLKHCKNKTGRLRWTDPD